MGHLYTKMKVFHYKDKIDSLPAGKKEIMPPVHIRIKPTNVCNHNCWYCAYKVESIQLGKDMVTKDFIPEEKMKEIIDDLIEMDVKAVTFSGGGEPFCYPYLLTAAKKLAASKINFAALTNGSKLEGEVAEIFAKNATWVRVSMDGWDDKSYEQYRGVKSGEFTKIMRNMSNFKRLGKKCYLGVSYIIDKNNTEHIYNFIKDLKGIGVDSVKISPCIVSNNVKECGDYHKDIFHRVKELAAKAKRELSDEKFEIYDSYHELDQKFKKDYDWCPYLQILPVIGADLNIYPCQDKAYNLEEGLIGSIKNCRFKDFWISDKNKFFKINPACHCNHHCVANDKNKLILEYLNVDNNHIGFV
ncbi:MAG: radical SAM protein [Candidatus Omnitrophica bacterium]|nr:radical SAM protein [Candidatus Omnitrophota bacterium]